MCGNYKKVLEAGELREGSPPRVRELQISEIVPLCDLGITPACAGITPPRRTVRTRGRDHPRVCGNYTLFSDGKKTSPGSPPRVRELPLMKPRLSSEDGITPACAGITYRDYQDVLAAEDHPRVCGNYLRYGMREVVMIGSPPRVRELQCDPRGPVLATGITPACAGITNQGLNFQSYPRDHPRVCGNYLDFARPM